MPDEPAEEPENFDTPPPFFPYEDGEGPWPHPEGYGEPVQVQVDGVYAAQTNERVDRYVILSDGLRKLPIMIGAFETVAITLPLENQKPERPMTHDLLAGILARLDAVVDRIVIDDLWNTTYYAKIYLRPKDSKEEMEIDCRPSDAIALAVRVDAPIYVADGILEQANPP